MPKAYEPSQYEADIYALWEKSGVFAPRSSGKPFSVVVPPPNANASLHIGFALTMSLEDIAVRYHRLKGDRTLFLPGADHAGFETQAVYEKQLAAKGRADLISPGRSSISKYGISWLKTEKILKPNFAVSAVA